MYYVYILQSLKDRKYYIGYTKNLERRLQEHNRGKTRSVKGKGPFKILYTEAYTTQLQAIHRERQIKKYKSGAAFKKLLRNVLAPSSSLV